MPAKKDKMLKFWSLTVSQNFSVLPTIERMTEILIEFSLNWMFQLEKGTDLGKLHYQIRMILSEAQYKSTLLAVFKCRLPNIEDVKFCAESNNSISQGGLSFYVMKDETRVDGPWYDPSYQICKKVAYLGNDLKCMENPLAFQQRCIDMMSVEPDDRTINWICQEAGNAGKSKLMKFLRCNSKFDMVRIPLGTATQIKTNVIASGVHKIYVVDLSKVRGSHETQADLFSSIEEVKNGWVISAMYGKCGELLMEPPHVFIFSNEMPNLTLCSLDRWKLWRVELDLTMSRVWV